MLSSAIRIFKRVSQVYANWYYRTNSGPTSLSSAGNSINLSAPDAKKITPFAASVHGLGFALQTSPVVQPDQCFLDIRFSCPWIDGAGAQHRPALQYSGRDQREPILEDALHQPEMSGVIGALVAKTHDSHLRRRHDLPAGHFAQPRLGELRQREASLHSRSKSRHSEYLDRHPQLQRSKAARKLQAVIGKIELGRMLLRVPQIFRQNQKRVAQMGQFTHQNAADF